jgi:hypothetical protein
MLLNFRVGVKKYSYENGFILGEAFWTKGGVVQKF